MFPPSAGNPVDIYLKNPDGTPVSPGFPGSFFCVMGYDDYYQGKNTFVFYSFAPNVVQELVHYLAWDAPFDVLHDGSGIHISSGTRGVLNYGPSKLKFDCRIEKLY
jgi:hypothetical protein